MAAYDVEIGNTIQGKIVVDVDIYRAEKEDRWGREWFVKIKFEDGTRITVPQEDQLAEI